MDIYNKPIDSKRYVPFTSNHQRHCLTDIPFSLARRIWTIVENENVKKKKKKNPRSLIEACIFRAKEMPVEIL